MMNSSSLFASYDSSAVVNLIVNKLPYQLQEKWTNEASRYKEQHNLAFPPFHFFASFLERMARVKNDPSFVYEDENFKPYKPRSQTTSHSVFVKKSGCASHELFDRIKDFFTCAMSFTQHKPYLE